MSATPTSVLDRIKDLDPEHYSVPTYYGPNNRSERVTRKNATPRYRKSNELHLATVERLMEWRGELVVVDATITLWEHRGEVRFALGYGRWTTVTSIETNGEWNLGGVNSRPMSPTMVKRVEDLILGEVCGLTPNGDGKYVAKVSKAFARNILLDLGQDKARKRLAQDMESEYAGDLTSHADWSIRCAMNGGYDGKPHVYLGHEFTADDVHDMAGLATKRAVARFRKLLGEVK